MELPDFPPKVDLANEVYQPLPKLTVAVNWDTIDAADTAERMLRGLSTALENNGLGLEHHFRTDGSYWRDTLAITSHLRTFKNPGVIAIALSGQNRKCHILDIAITSGSTQVVIASETLVSRQALSRSIRSRTCEGGVNVEPALEMD
jgi:hypothetical protein